tara:strand:- start:587 stop:877 length:291 start_codon:yes stop_codon:yes gene_type:complete
MGKKNRRKGKKMKEKKTLEERKLEMDGIKEKLTNLGLVEEMEGIKEFYERVKDFEKTGDGWSGKIKVPGTKRILDIRLTSNKLKECAMVLLYDEMV